MKKNKILLGRKNARKREKESGRGKKREEESRGNEWVKQKKLKKS